MENPSLAHDIGQYILQLLPHEKLKSCRLVNSSMKQLIDHPNFWIEKFKREKNMSNENVTKWVKLIQLAKNVDEELCEMLVRIFVECGDFEWESIVLLSETPIFFAALIGNVKLCQLIFKENIDDANVKNSKLSPLTPLDMSATCQVGSC